MSRKIVVRVFAVSMMAVMAMAVAPAAAPDLYEAEDADRTSDAQIVSHSGASGGSYVQMRVGNLSFSVTAPAAGFYTVWARFSQTCDDSKTQNLVVNGTQVGQITFPATGPHEGNVCGPVAFEHFKAAGKVNLSAGANTVAITNSWGWVDIDYIEIGPYVPEPFNVPLSLVTPNASLNARKMYQFLRENFQKKVISGVMTDRAAQDDGKYTPHTHVSQPEMAHIYSASTKYPALMGLDFMHGTGLKSDDMWFQGYNNGTISLAEEFYKAGGIPIYCWHWKDPLKQTEQDAFYSKETNFSLSKAFKDPATCTMFDESSAEYQGIIEDIDKVSGYLKRLADKDIPVLWRPLHEAAGGWFWWGSGIVDAQNNVRPAAWGPAACSALWRLMFERMTNHHGLNNLIWVWTTEESGRELEWYPGDAYVDIIGRDYYPSPYQGARATGSLMSSFENIKSIFGAKKIIALSENGSIPYPDSLVADGAGWSWFMSWNGEFVKQTNTAADWNHIMNHSYVITLEDMPGWDNYQYTTSAKPSTAKPKAASAVSVKARRGVLELNIRGMDARTVELFNLRGARIAVLNKSILNSGTHRLPIKNKAKQMCVLRVTSVDKRVVTMPIKIE